MTGRVERWVAEQTMKGVTMSKGTSTFVIALVAILAVAVVAAILPGGLTFASAAVEGLVSALSELASGALNTLVALAIGAVLLSAFL